MGTASNAVLFCEYNFRLPKRSMTFVKARLTRLYYGAEFAIDQGDNKKCRL